MDSVIGHKPATQPPIVEETVSVSDEVGDYDSQPLEDVEECSDSCSSVSTPHCYQSACSSRSVTPPVTSEGKARQQESRKRERPVDAKVHKMEQLLEKMVKVQEDSDRYHMRMEEKLTEMEEKRQEESREFQLSLLALMGNQTRASESQPSFFGYRPSMS